MQNEQTLSLLCDFYEITMGRGYFAAGLKELRAHFDVFFRSNPDGGGYAIAAGLEQVIEYINAQSRQFMGAGKKVGVIGTDETIDRYRADVCKSAGTRTKDSTIGRDLYRILREFDDEETEIIFSESFHTEGFGQAIMNRLLKAAGHKVIDLGGEKV